MPDFDPTKHVVQIKFRGARPRDYLPVSARVMWLRADHIGAQIETWLISDDGSRSTWGARVTLPDGSSATGFGSRRVSDDRGDYFEAGETRALGRALAHVGIATEYISPDEMDEGQAETGDTAAVDSGRAPKQPPTPTAREMSGKPEPQPMMGKPSVPLVITPAENELNLARATLKLAAKDFNWLESALLETATKLWPHIKSKQDMGTLNPAQLSIMAGIIREQRHLVQDGDRWHTAAGPKPPQEQPDEVVAVEARQ